MKYLTLFIVFLLFLIGCDNHEEKKINNEKFHVIKEYYSDGKLKVEGGVIYDTLWHGEYKSFYPNGNIRRKSNYLFGKENGVSLFYYENGNLKQDCKGIKDDNYGKCYFYSNDGFLELINLFDYLDETFYVIEMDKKGEVIYEEGMVFSPNIEFSVPKDSIKFKQQVEIKLAIAELDNKRTILKVNKDGNIFEVPINNCSATYKTIFNKKGKCSIEFIGEIYNENNEIYKTKREVILLNIN